MIKTTTSYAMNTEGKAVGWGFWAKWTLGSFLGLIVGVATFFGLGTLAGEALDRLPDFMFGLLIAAIFGSTFSTAQWLVLRRRVGGIGAWVPLTVASWGVFWALNVAGVFPEGEGLVGKAAEGLWHGFVLGATVGAAQWVALRRRVSGAGWWVIIHALCWSLSAAAGDAGRVLLDNAGGVDLLIAFALSIGLTGLGMTWLLRRSSTRS